MAGAPLQALPARPEHRVGPCHSRPGGAAAGHGAGDWARRLPGSVNDVPAAPRGAVPGPVRRRAAMKCAGRPICLESCLRLLQIARRRPANQSAGPARSLIGRSAHLQNEFQPGKQIGNGRLCREFFAEGRMAIKRPRNYRTSGRTAEWHPWTASVARGPCTPSAAGGSGCRSWRAAADARRPAQ